MKDTPKRSKFGSIVMTIIIVSSVLAAGLALVAGPAAASGDVTVQVNATDGTGIEGADVVVRDASDDSAAASGVTDSNGTFTASGVSDGDYYAEVSDPGYVDVPETDTVTITASNAQIDVELIAANELANNTVAVSNDTESAYGDVSGADDLSSLADNSSRAGFRVVGLNHSEEGNSSTTNLKDTTAAVTEGNTTSFEYVLSDDDVDSYDELRVVVEGNGNHSSSVEAGTLEAATGGGGSGGFGNGILASTFMGIPIVFLIAVAAVAGVLYKRED